MKGYQNIQDKLALVARDWFLADFVKLCQVFQFNDMKIV